MKDHNYTKAKELIGIKHNLLTIVDIDGKSGGNGKPIIVICKCECGKIVHIRKSRFMSRKAVSCGCLSRLKITQRNTKHGLYGTRLYNIWNGIMSRTRYKDKKYKACYWGRGINICDEWASNFVAFKDWALKNGYQDNLTIDRIDVDGDYCPQNCRWITPAMQAKNRRNNVQLEFAGKVMILADWARLCGVHPTTLRKRIEKYGLTEKTFFKGRYNTNESKE